MKNRYRGSAKPSGKGPMNKLVLLATSAVFLASATTAEACDTSLELRHDSARIFDNQSLVLPGPANISDVIVTCGHFYGERWQAATDSDADNETDWTAGGHATSGRFTGDANISKFEIYGDDAYRLRATVAYDLTQHWSVSVNADAIRGGFETDVLRGQLRGHAHLFGPVDGNLTLGLSTDSWSGDFDGQLKAGISISVARNTALNVDYSRFDVISEGRADRPGESHGDVLGVSITHNFQGFPHF